MRPRLGKSRPSKNWQRCYTENRSVKLRKVSIQTDDDPQILCIAQLQCCDSCVYTWTTLFFHPDRNLEDFSLKKWNRLRIKKPKIQPHHQLLPTWSDSNPVSLPYCPHTELPVSSWMPFSLSFFFNWRIIALQNFVVFCQTSTWTSHRYTYIPSLLNLTIPSF